MSDTKEKIKVMKLKYKKIKVVVKNLIKRLWKKWKYGDNIKFTDATKIEFSVDGKIWVDIGEIFNEKNR